MDILDKKQSSRSGHPKVVDRRYTNFYEKARFVKPTWRLYASWPSATVLCALRAMLLSALLVSQLSLVTRCIMGSVFSG
jgi:hypothetical protein